MKILIFVNSFINCSQFSVSIEAFNLCELLAVIWSVICYQYDICGSKSDMGSRQNTTNKAKQICMRS